MSTPVRVRFCPSPTGSPHVGFARTALYNWAFVRHAQRFGDGGTLVFRIEDTDKERSTEESYDAMIGAMQWLGLDWDEGPIVGGPHGPYRQSERTEIYRDVLARLAESKFTYDCFCTTEEVEARRKASGSKVMGYDGFCRDLSAEQRAAFEAVGRQPVVRFRMPDGSVTWDDLVRGEDLLSSTPRQIPLHRALVELGISTVVPEFGHLPFVMGEGNKKLSKRDPQAHLFGYRDDGFLPEGLLNYLALLGWSIAADRDVFTMDEMVEAFDIRDVNPNPARFDLKKAEAINSAHMRLLPLEEMTERVLPYLERAGVLDPTDLPDRQLLDLAMPLVAERINKLTEAVDMLGFLFVDEAAFTRDEADSAKALTEDGLAVVRAAYDALAGLESWSTAAIQDALQVTLVDGLGLKPRNAFGPVRVAVTGRRVSPPLFESMELLGRERSLGRLQDALG